MSLAQLIEKLHYICKNLEFESRSFHLFTLNVEFLIIKLLKKSIIRNINICDILGVFGTSNNLIHIMPKMLFLVYFPSFMF
jgi:hypothetical protein